MQLAADPVLQLWAERQRGCVAVPCCGCSACWHTAAAAEGVIAGRGSN